MDFRKRKRSHIGNSKPRGKFVSNSKSRLYPDTNFVLSKFHVLSGNFNELNYIYTVRNFRIETLPKIGARGYEKKTFPHL